MEDGYNVRPFYTRLWEQELGEVMGEEDWKKSFRLAYTGICSTQIREKNFKVQSRWYRCPADVSRYNKDIQDCCWRCGVGWWGCSAVRKFWGGVLKVFEKVSGINIENTPRVTLLSMIPGCEGKSSRRLLQFFLGAARMVIPRLWKTMSEPLLIDWVKERKHQEDGGNISRGKRSGGEL